MPILLLTGFGPFPGAPFNPTGPLVARLARQRRPALADVTIIAHVFPTSYAAVDRDLPELVARHRPDAILMFGLASRARTLRIETRARNAVALLPDAGGAARAATIAPGGPRSLALPAPVMQLLAAGRAARVPIMRSHDAGHYLCNYLCWRAAEAAHRGGGPRITAFVHVPQVRSRSARHASSAWLSADDLLRAGARLIKAVAAAARQQMNTGAQPEPPPFSRK